MVPQVGLSISTIEILPVQLHALSYALFGSLIGPFGGFFASAVKRALNVKDFGSSIPGHGGVVDRFDCQMIMASFGYFYHKAFLLYPSKQDWLLARVCQTFFVSLCIAGCQYTVLFSLMMTHLSASCCVSVCQSLSTLSVYLFLSLFSNCHCPLVAVRVSACLGFCLFVFVCLSVSVSVFVRVVCLCTRSSCLWTRTPN